MKKRTILILVFIMSILFIGCTNKNVENNVTDKVEDKVEEKVDEKVDDKVDIEDQLETEDITNPNDETKEPPLEPIEEEEPAIITDEAIIKGMARDIVSKMTTEEKVGQLFIVNLELLDTTNGSHYEFQEITDEMKKTIEKFFIGGVCLFSRNIANPEQTKELNSNLQKASKIPMFITVDEEGGDVSRIASNNNMKTTQFPTMEEIGATKDEQYAYEMGNTIGKEIKELGFNVNFAPVADVKTNEWNTEIGNRSFGSDSKIVSNMVKEVVKGIQDSGISATLKHFPGHGDVSEDSHYGSVNVENDIERLRKVEFAPFRSGIKEKVDFVMVSHISVSRITESTVPSSLSSLVINQMLRKELGFNGIAITDAMNMKAITDYYTPKQAALKSFNAGIDIILMPENFEQAYNAILNAVNKGTFSNERLEESVIRIIETKIRRGLIRENTDLLQNI